MAKNKKDVKQYRCMNFGACSKADSNEIIEISTLETISDVPDCPHCHQHTLEELPPKNMKWKPIAFLVSILAIGGLAAYLFSGGNKTAEQPTEVVAPVDSDSIRMERIEEEQQRMRDDSARHVNDSLQALADSLSKAATVSQPRQNESPSRKPTAVSGTKDLGYATFRGTLKGGLPDDVNGRLIFNTSHAIDSRDPKGRMAEAGDYVIGEFSEGHLVQGIWYGADNQVKGSVIIGK